MVIGVYVLFASLLKNFHPTFWCLLHIFTRRHIVVIVLFACCWWTAVLWNRCTSTCWVSWDRGVWRNKTFVCASSTSRLAAMKIQPRYRCSSCCFFLPFRMPECRKSSGLFMSVLSCCISLRAASFPAEFFVVSVVSQLSRIWHFAADHSVVSVVQWQHTFFRHNAVQPNCAESCMQSHLTN